MDAGALVSVAGGIVVSVMLDCGLLVTSVLCVELDEVSSANTDATGVKVCAINTTNINHVAIFDFSCFSMINLL